MADYYPLISRAVAGLEKNNGENRRALYERARAALLAQLRGVTPPLNESDITRERLALEESIRKVEAESARQFVEASRQSRAAKFRSVEPRSTISRQSEEPPPASTGPAEPVAPPRRYVSPSSQPPQEAPSALSPDLGRRSGTPSSSPSLPDSQQSDSIFDRPLRPEPPPFGGERRAFSDAELRDAASLSTKPARPPRARGEIRTRHVRRRSGVRHRGRRTPVRPAAIRPRRAPHVRSAGAAGAHVRSGRAARTRAARRFLRADAGAGIGPRQLAFRCPPGTARAAAADR